MLFATKDKKSLFIQNIYDGNANGREEYHPVSPITQTILAILHTFMNRRSSPCITRRAYNFLAHLFIRDTQNYGFLGLLQFSTARDKN